MTQADLEEVLCSQYICPETPTWGSLLRPRLFPEAPEAWLGPGDPPRLLPGSRFRCGWERVPALPTTDRSRPQGLSPFQTALSVLSSTASHATWGGRAHSADGETDRGKLTAACGPHRSFYFYFPTADVKREIRQMWRARIWSRRSQRSLDRLRQRQTLWTRGVGISRQVISVN